MSRLRGLPVLVTIFICMSITGCADRQCVCPDERTTVVFEDDFESGDLAGWTDHSICSDIGAHQFALLFCEEDTNQVLMHQGGYSAGGGNGEFVADEVSCYGDIVIEVEIRNMAAYHTTAKAMGLAACLDQSSGTQYLVWYTVAGDLFLYRTTGWLSCGPDPLAHVQTSPVPLGGTLRMDLSVVGDVLSVAIDDEVLISCQDPSGRLPGGGVGLVATAGVTYFDNVAVTEAK